MAGKQSNSQTHPGNAIELINLIKRIQTSTDQESPIRPRASKYPTTASNQISPASTHKQQPHLSSFPIFTYQFSISRQNPRALIIFAPACNPRRTKRLPGSSKTVCARGFKIPRAHTVFATHRNPRRTMRLAAPAKTISAPAPKPKIRTYNRPP